MSEHEDAGYGFQKIGFGEWPAILVVDFQTAFTESQYELGRSSMIQAAVEKTAELLEVARSKGVPVAKCYTAYESKRDIPYWKVKAVSEEFYYGHPSTEMESKIHDPDYDFSFCKTGPSIFFQTPLVSFLVKNRVDTAIITGCTTSGCIRGSTIDAFSYGYRTMIPRECVGDMAAQPHEDNLRDVDRRYADVIDLESTLEYINRFPDK
jgi:maleamate amidohydrolase